MDNICEGEDLDCVFLSILLFIFGEIVGREGRMAGWFVIKWYRNWVISKRQSAGKALSNQPILV